jgi:hypothetical protein
MDDLPKSVVYRTTIADQEQLTSSHCHKRSERPLSRELPLPTACWSIIDCREE